MLYAVLAVSSIARGRVTFLDVAAAKAHPGVVEVMTPANRPPLAQDPDAKTNPFMFRLDVLQNDTVRYANQPIAVVIAETLEAATEGAALLSPRYEAEPARVGLDAGESFVPPGVGVGTPAEAHRGDVEAGLAAASRRIDATYETPAQYHNAMEPHAIVAAWDGDRLSIDTPSQGLAMAQGRIAGLFGIPPENIHIRSPFLGGGFGSKGLISGPQVLGILAARLVGRPVKLVLRREQMYGPVGHRAPTRQTLRMGTDGDGALTAIDHHTKTASSTFDDFFEPAADVSHTLYASPAIATSHEAVRLDTGTPLFMRAPGEATGSIALESAIDEMAQACGMDPLAFRLTNYAEVEPISGKPFSSKALRECYAQGAERFGWARRPLAPRQMRDEAGLLVGWGIGTAIFPALMFQGERAGGDPERRHRRHGDRRPRHGPGRLDRARPDRRRRARARHRPGRVPIRHVGPAGCRHRRRLGPYRDRRHGDPQRRRRRDRQARGPRHGRRAFAAVRRGQCRRGRARAAGCSAATTRAAARAMPTFSPAPASRRSRGAARARPIRPRNRTTAMHAHGAVFAEVKVDPDLGQIRVTRLVGAFAAGRVINPRLVRSQYFGGMIWGVSFALHEQAVIDRRSGRVMNAEPWRVPCAGERRRALAGGHPGRRARSARQRARHQGRRRDRHHGHGRRDRQRGLARDRDPRSPVPDHPRPADRAHALIDNSGTLAACGFSQASI